ncbi:TPA: SIR2 family protein [Serratia fonticola]
MTTFRPWLDDQSAANVPLDQIFNLLHLEYGKDEVNALVTKRLSAPQAIEDVGREHALIKRISSNQSGKPQIVTTNFDLLFEVNQEGEELVRHVPPAFPDLNFGSKIEGITYLHGRLVEEASENHPYVLSSADFGRAYLSEGWATNFIKLLLERYIVVLVGYQAEDPPIKYLLQGLNHDGQYDRSRLYAFDRGLSEEIEAKWRDRGVTAIAYSDHPILWKSMEAWAERADDPRRWRASIIDKTQQDPKTLAPHERGQVAHVLRTAQGTRLFSEADPLPHPEWVCVMDGNIRLAKQKQAYSADAEAFDPQAAYRLDDDLQDISDDNHKQGVSNDDLLIWRDGDDNPSDCHRLGGRQIEGFEVVSKRLGHLITWFSKSIDSPVVAWWAIRQNGIHPRLLQQFEWKVRHSTSLHKCARHIWGLIIEYHKDHRNRQHDHDWYELIKRINIQGWTAGVLREFRRVTSPRLNINLPSGLGQFRPPNGLWKEIQFSELGQFEVVFLERHNRDLDIPDDVLPHVFSILEEQLIFASGLLEDINTSYFSTPSCYNEREIYGKGYVSQFAKILTWIVPLFDQMADKWPEVTNARATIWPITERFFFRKLKLYAFSKVGVFKADHVAKEVLSLEHEAFWDANVVRELLFLLVDRWEEFSQDNQKQIIERILVGPNRLSYWSEAEYPILRNKFAAIYARYLELKGCELTKAHSERLTEMIKDISGWNDGWATSVVISWGSRTGWVSTDEKPDVIQDLPVNEVIPKAKEELRREYDNFTRKRPFTGLVKENPRKALSALTIAGKTGDYPEEFWSSMISELPADITPRLRRIFLKRIAQLPKAIVVELRHTLSHWLEQNLLAIIKFDAGLGWVVYDHIVESILSGGANATKSGIGEVRQGGKIIMQSRRTYSHAINGPIGMCTKALFNAVPGEEQEAGSLFPHYIKYRVELLFTAPGEGAEHCASITASNLNWLMSVDPDWAKENFIPMLAFEHPASESAWNGFLHGDAPSPSLAKLIKPLLLDLIPWVEKLSWERDFSAIASQWLGLIRVFYPNESGGLSRSEMRSVLRTMSDETRIQFIFWLGRVGQENDNGWTKHVIPLINEDWPREHQYRTSASMRGWVSLLNNAGDSFPLVYEAVKRFLVPVETNDHPFYRFTKELGEEKPITVIFPETTLDLMNRATPQKLTRPPYELQQVLTLIAETESGLTSDPRYVRLIDLVERN